ncbi:MAG: hypothetical protein HYS09_04485 [Chloroflexi bacterium]|nr:hypothetical protein [Chloroflexota bacterium]
MAHIRASFPDTVPSVSPVIEQNDLKKPPMIRYWLRFGPFDLYLNRPEAESLHRDLDCLLRDPDARVEARCFHSRPD